MWRINEWIFRIIIVLFMVAIMFLTLYPFWYIIMASMSNPFLVADYRGLLLLPLEFTLEPYKFAFENPNIPTGFINSLMYTTLGTFISMTLTTIGAYVLSRREFMLKNPIMFMIVFTMFFSGGIIPYFLIVMRLGMINTIWSVIIPGAISTWNLIVMRTSFLGIPVSLEEAASIDGVNELMMLLKIIIPVSLPLMAVMSLFYAVGYWNSWFWPSIFLQDRSLLPLQVFLREILIQNVAAAAAEARAVEGLKTRMVVRYAIVVITTIPIVIIYPFFQRHFEKGVIIGALKG